MSSSPHDCCGLQGVVTHPHVGRADDCLVKAGGQPEGTLSFASWHSYADGDSFADYSQFSHEREAFKDPRPIVIGEFASKAGANMTSPQMYDYAIGKGYAGAWGWSALGQDGMDNLAILSTGMAAIRGDPATQVTIL
jgi:hypothetical protein